MIQFRIGDRSWMKGIRLETVPTLQFTGMIDLSEFGQTVRFYPAVFASQSFERIIEMNRFDEVMSETADIDHAALSQ